MCHTDQIQKKVQLKLKFANQVALCALRSMPEKALGMGFSKACTSISAAPNVTSKDGLDRIKCPCNSTWQLKLALKRCSHAQLRQLDKIAFEVEHGDFTLNMGCEPDSSHSHWADASFSSEAQRLDLQISNAPRPSPSCTRRGWYFHGSPSSPAMKQLHTWILNVISSIPVWRKRCMFCFITNLLIYVPLLICMCTPVLGMDWSYCFVHCEYNRVQVTGCLIGHVAWQHYDGFQSRKTKRCLREVLTNQSYTNSEVTLQLFMVQETQTPHSMVLWCIMYDCYPLQISRLNLGHWIRDEVPHLGSAFCAVPTPESWMIFDQTARLPHKLRFFVDSRGHGMFRKAASASSVTSFLRVLSLPWMHSCIALGHFGKHLEDWKTSHLIFLAHARPGCGGKWKPQVNANS